MEALKRRIDQYKKTAEQELPTLRLALSHVEERLKTLNPGINVTMRTYSELLEQRQALTQCVNDCILVKYGDDINKADNQLFTTNSVLLRLGGSLRARLRV